MNPFDMAVYAWAALLVLCIGVGFPPAFAVLLLFPRWHRGRMSRRSVRLDAAQREALIKHWSR